MVRGGVRPAQPPAKSSASHRPGPPEHFIRLEICKFYRLQRRYVLVESPDSSFLSCRRLEGSGIPEHRTMDCACPELHSLMMKLGRKCLHGEERPDPDLTEGFPHAFLTVHSILCGDETFVTVRLSPDCWWKIPGCGKFRVER